MTRWKRNALLVVVGIVFLLLLARLRGVLTPLFIGGLIAYVVNSLVLGLLAGFGGLIPIFGVCLGLAPAANALKTLGRELPPPQLRALAEEEPAKS